MQGIRFARWDERRAADAFRADSRAASASVRAGFGGGEAARGGVHGEDGGEQWAGMDEMGFGVGGAIISGDFFCLWG